jgi:hypothetical protein
MPQFDPSVEPLQPYADSYYTTVPTRFTRFLRANVLWQGLRFLWVNLKMTMLLVRSHGGYRVDR